MVFDQFEAIAIPAIARYNGQPCCEGFDLRQTVILKATLISHMKIQLAEFKTDKDFKDFMEDETRKQFLHLKEQSIQSVFLIKGLKL